MQWCVLHSGAGNTCGTGAMVADMCYMDTVIVCELPVHSASQRDRSIRINRFVDVLSLRRGHATEQAHNSGRRLATARSGNN